MFIRGYLWLGGSVFIFVVISGYGTNNINVCVYRTEEKVDALQKCHFLFYIFLNTQQI